MTNAYFDVRRALSIARKEVHHIRRDPVTLAMSLLLPLFLVLFFGFAINLNVRNVRLLATDDDKTRTSRELIDLFSASGYFHVDFVDSPGEAVAALGAESAKAALIIPPHFQHDVRAGRA